MKPGLVRVTGGQISAGPSAIAMSGDLTKGLRLDMALVMTTPADAKGLESFVKTQQGLLGYAAQVKGLGKMVDAITVSSSGDTVKFHVELSMDDLNRVVSALDAAGSAAQDSPPSQ